MTHLNYPNGNSANTSTERCSAPQTLLMGATFVTEGALPFALRDPLRVSLACIAGSALAGFITILLGCGCPAPHGGLFLLPVMENPPGFLIALAVGTLTTALLLLGTSTVSVAFIPGYETVGMWAPVLLALTRIGQGVALGGA